MMRFPALEHAMRDPKLPCAESVQAGGVFPSSHDKVESDTHTAIQVLTGSADHHCTSTLRLTRRYALPQNLKQ